MLGAEAPGENAASAGPAPGAGDAAGARVAAATGSNSSCRLGRGRDGVRSRGRRGLRGDHGGRRGHRCGHRRRHLLGRGPHPHVTLCRRRTGTSVGHRDLLDRRASAGHRGRGGGHRRELLARGHLDRRVGALAQRRRLVLGRPDQRLEQAAQAACAPAGRARGAERHGRHEGGHRARHGAELAQPATAAQAGPEVRPERGQVLRARLPVHQRREHRRQAVALRPGLDALDPLGEGAPPLRQAAVHLRVRPPGDLADLPVGVALGLEEKRAHLLRLQHAHGLRPLAQPLESRGLLVGGGGVGAGIGHVAVVADRRMALALAAHRERLVLHHRLEPGHQPLGVERGGLGEQDLDAALVGVLGVLGVGGPAPRGGHHLGPVTGQELERGRVDLRA